MKMTEIQAKTLTPSWLLAKGYTIAAAARRIGRSHNHVRMVLYGKRQSRVVLSALAALPPRELNLRERISR